MTKLAANLSMMFNEVDFLDRFGLAAKAGFKGVEYLFPYDYPAEQIKCAQQPLASSCTIPSVITNNRRPLQGVVASAPAEREAKDPDAACGAVPGRRS